MSIATGSSRQNLCVTGDPSPASIWHTSAPRAVQNAYWAGSESVGWKAWRRRLRTRKRPVEPAQLLVGGDQALTWGLEDRQTSTDRWGRHSCLLGAGKNACHTPDVAEALHQWLRDATGGEFKLDYALSALAWCRCLPSLAAVLPAVAWWNLLDHLLHTAAEAGAAGAGRELSDDEPLLHQLLAGELALTLAYLFPEITACRQWMPAARQALSSGLANLLDGRGFLHARHFGRLRLLLACWTRCRALGGRLKHGCWNHEAEKQYRRLVRNALRLARRDGSHVFSSPSTDRSDAELLLAAVALTGDQKGCTPAAAVHSEWAAAAVLRSDGSRSAPRLTVLYPDTSCRVELTCGKDVLCSGPWALELHVDGTPAAPTSEWTKLCWVSDDDVDYLELEIEFGQRLCVQRHLLLAREDRFLLLADAVLASRRAAIEYRGTLPLCQGVTFREACETREGVLVGRKPRATVLPLALPEWLSDRRGGALASTRAGLELRQAAEAQALFAPLFFDLDRSRMNKPLTWRRLTVAESQVVQPADVAAGYRVAIGNQQWLIYRSLTGSRNRSLLGHNLQSETLVARFDRKGNVEPLIEIE